MPELGDRRKVTVTRYGRREEQTVEFCSDGKWHFCRKETKKKPPLSTEKEGFFEGAPWEDD